MTKNPIFLFLFYWLSGTSQIQWQFNKDSLITWYYQEGDEFNGDTLNRTYWSDWFGWARSISGNKEQQYYSKYRNHFLKDGKLILTAKKEPVIERYIDWMNDQDSTFNNGKFDDFNKRSFNYTAGMIQSRHDFLYGYFEIKFRIPKEKGFWPAFWLYGGSPNEEIDWMELKTERPDQIHVGRHCQNKKDNYEKTFFGKKVWGDWVKFNGSLNEGYNVISGIWTSSELIYFLNGECIAIAHSNMKNPKKLVANIAVSSNKGSFPPAPSENFKDSVNYELDYIRVWSRVPQNSNRQRSTGIMIEENITGAEALATSSLISKSKIHYGKKSEHANEGFFATWMPEVNSKYQLTVSGKEISKNSQVTLRYKNGKEIYASVLSYGVTTFDLQKYRNETLELFITDGSHKTNYTFTVY